MAAAETIGLSEPPNKRIKRGDQASNQPVTGARSNTTTTMASAISSQIDLLPAEQLLRRLLLDCRDYILVSGDKENDGASSSSSQHGNNKNNKNNKCRMRFVGGWVRDKLLGKQSADIDVALSTMAGPEFADHLKRYLAEHAQKYKEEATRLGVPPEIRGFYRIEKNPGKGKHLETTSVMIFGLDVDFAQLRTEGIHCYQEEEEQDSREVEKKVEKKEEREATIVPPTSFNSAPQEDAYRRDATVNAIFYNIETQKIEDYTRKGLTDIEARVLRTPLHPYITFTDDPLRILRLIRLASTLQFTIDNAGHEESTQQAMTEPDIQSALSTRVSRQRIGVELKKMTGGPDPVTALKWIYELHLYPTVFLDFQNQNLDSIRNMDQERQWPSSTWLIACETVSNLLNETADSHLATKLIKSEDVEMVWQMAVWSPLAQLQRNDELAIGDSAIVQAAAKAIGATTKKSKLLADSFKNMNNIRSTIEQVVDSLSPKRSTLGMAIRTWGITWKLQVLFSLLDEIMLKTASSPPKERILERYSTFLQLVSDHKLQEASTLKSILNGGDIKMIFGLKTSGPFMKDTSEAVLRWQFDHEEDEKDRNRLKEAATEWLRGQKEILKIPDA